MKAVICADLHLDGTHDMRPVLSAIVDRTLSTKADALFIAGDLFETRNLIPDTLDFVKTQLLRLPETYIFISAGNNDPLSEDSPYKTTEWPSNVVIFGNSLEVMEIELLNSERVRVYGQSADTAQMSRNLFKDGAPELDYDYTNILLVHTSLEAHTVNPISQKQINSIGFDLCIFGHNHKYSGIRPTKSTSYVYPGQPNEMGGILVGDIRKGEQHLLEFVPGNELIGEQESDEEEFKLVGTEIETPDVPNEWKLGAEFDATIGGIGLAGELAREKDEQRSKRVRRVRQLRDRLDSLRFEASTIEHYTAMRRVPGVVIATILLVLDCLALALLIMPTWIANKIIYDYLKFLTVPYEFAMNGGYYIYVVGGGILILLLMLMLVFSLSSMGAKKTMIAEKRIEIQKNRLAEVILPEITEVIDELKDSESAKRWGKRDIFTDNDYEFLETDDEVLARALEKFERKYGK